MDKRKYFKGSSVYSKCVAHDVYCCQCCSHNMHLNEDKENNMDKRKKVVVRLDLTEYESLLIKAALRKSSEELDRMEEFSPVDPVLHEKAIKTYELIGRLC